MDILFTLLAAARQKFFDQQDIGDADRIQRFTASNASISGLSLANAVLSLS